MKGSLLACLAVGFALVGCATSYEPQTTLQRPDPVKRYGQLTHIKGPNVTSPPQVLQAEYMDTGEGYGPARILYPNKVLEGSYQTVASGQSFKGVVQRSLILTGVAICKVPACEDLRLLQARMGPYWNAPMR